MLEFEDLSGCVIGAAIDVHRELGPGFLESIYESALCIAMTNRGLKFQKQYPVQVHYQGVVVGRHRLDLLVENALIVELKASKCITQMHIATAGSYLKATGLENALLLNFSSLRLEIKRLGGKNHKADHHDS